MRKLIFLISLAATLGAGAFLFMRYAGPTNDEKRDTVVRVLKSIPRSFLVVITHETLVVSHRDGGNWILGPRRGQSSITVRVHWGINLEKIVRNDINVSGRRITVKLPDPEVFDQSPDLLTWQYVGKRSGLFIIWDALCGQSLERELLMDVQRALPQYSQADFDIQRLAILDRLNRNAASIFDGTGLVVRFD